MNFLIKTFSEKVLSKMNIIRAYKDWRYGLARIRTFKFLRSNNVYITTDYGCTHSIAYFHKDNLMRTFFTPTPLPQFGISLGRACNEDNINIVLNHESLHLILSKVENQRTSRQLDNVVPDNDFMFKLFNDNKIKKVNKLHWRK
jgi:hypothetical protein